MSFPPNPNVGDKFTFEDTVFKFNGRRWDRVIVGRSNSTDYSGGHTLVTTALLHRIAHLETLLENQFLILE
jgi:hypothetical protein